MQYYNKEAANERVHGGKGTLVAYFVIMIAVMGIFTFAIIVYSRHKKKKQDTLSSSTRDAGHHRVATEDTPTTRKTAYFAPRKGQVTAQDETTTEGRKLETFANLPSW
ncbi:uncharacterized protein LOC144174364 [Haemaphysalis longicornis]